MPRGSNTYGADGNIVIGTTVDMGGINTGLTKIQKSFRKLSYLTGGALGIVGFVKFGKAAIGAASDLQEVQNIVDVAFGDMEYKVEKFASTCIEKFGMSELAAKQTAGSFMAMGNSIGLSMEDASNMAIQLTSLTGDMASFYNISQDYARVALSAVYTGETETLKRYGIILTEANLQEYANTQNINKKVKAMSAAEKVALRYNYVMQATANMQGDFARTSGNWANQVRVLQQRWNEFLIVVGNGLITALTPLLKVLNQIIAALIRFAQIIGSILQNIFGFEFQSIAEQNNAIADSAGAAADAEDEVADATKKAGKAAKKALAPFDELNQLHKNTSSASGGSGGGGADFSVPDITGGQSIIDKLKNKLSSDIDTLYGLGKYISDTLRNMLLSIDWDSIYEGARNFGTGLAQFLNGLFQPETFYVVGQTIANALNTAIYTALSFAQEFDFANFGTALANAVNGFFENFDFASLANAIDAWVQGLYNALETFISEVEWDDVLNGLKVFLTNLDLDTVEIIIGALTIAKIGKIIWAFDFSKWFVGSIAPFFGQIAEAIWLGISGQIVALAGEGACIGEAFAAVFGGATTGAIVQAFTAIAGVIGGIVLAIANFVNMLKDGFSWVNEIFMVLGTILVVIGAIVAGVAALPAILIGGIVAAVATLAVVIHDHWEEIKAWFAGIGNRINTTIFQPIANCISRIIDKIKSVWEIVTSTFSKIGNWVTSHIFDPIIDKVTFIATFIKQIVESIGIIIKAVLMIVWYVFYSNVVQPITQALATLCEYIATLAKEIWNVIKNLLMTIYNNWMAYVIMPVVNQVVYLCTTIKSLVTILWGAIKSILSGIASWINTKVIQPILGFFQKLWDGIANGVKGAINIAIKVIESYINAIIDGINKFTSGLSAIAGVASKITGDNYSGIFTLDHVKLPKLAQGGVIPPNKEFMAILGDQKHGTNIEAPLDTIKQALAEVISDEMIGLLAQQLSVLQEIEGKDIVVDDNRIFKTVRNKARTYKKSTGADAFAF